MDRPVPALARWTFMIHMVVATLLGIALLVFPTVAGAALGYTDDPAGLITVLRSYGVLLMVFGGLTSFLGARARSWERVEIIVISEVAYLAVATFLYVFSLITGEGPVLGNVMSLVMCAVLLVLFWMSWRKRPV
ncbi:MAG: hypothetical protein ACYCYF_06045 [Anaerolineae bacterium]